MTTNLLIGIVGIIFIFILLGTGAKIGSVMCIIGFCGLYLVLTPSAASLKMATSAWEVLDSYSFSVMPLFVFMANILSCTGISRNLFEMFHRMVGRFRGGMAIATVLACGVFGAICSSSIATAITIGIIALPEMRRLKYSDSLCTGAIAAGGTLGTIIPPSGVLILYGIIAQQSILKLFVAGVLPGIIMISLFVVATEIYCRIYPDAGPSGPWYTWKEIGRAFLGCIDVFILLIVVIGGMFIGWFTPTESAAVGVLSSILIAAIRRKLTWKNFREAITGTLSNAGMIYVVLIGAQVLNYFMAISTVPTALAKMITNLHMSPTLVVLFMVAIYLVLGCFLDAAAMILLTMPIFYPIAMSSGIDPIWFGIVICICQQMACLTPPVGMNIFVVRGLDDSIPITKVYRGIIPYLIAQILVVVILFLFPSLATWLPGLVG